MRSLAAGQGAATSDRRNCRHVQRALPLPDLGLLRRGAPRRQVRRQRAAAVLRGDRVRRMPSRPSREPADGPPAVGGASGTADRAAAHRFGLPPARPVTRHGIACPAVPSVPAAWGGGRAVGWWMAARRTSGLTTFRPMHLPSRCMPGARPETGLQGRLPTPGIPRIAFARHCHHDAAPGSRLEVDQGRRTATGRRWRRCVPLPSAARAPAIPSKDDTTQRKPHRPATYRRAASHAVACTWSIRSRAS